MLLQALGIPQCVAHSLYRSTTRGPEDDSVESKYVAPLSHYMFNFTTVVFDGTSPAFHLPPINGDHLKIRCCNNFKNKLITNTTQTHYYEALLQVHKGKGDNVVSKDI